ncbi:MAG TPA: hypothetical protein VF659_15225 [Pyrinomonadaceae bacterium]|jgi:hypothetical protein
MPRFNFESIWSLTGRSCAALERRRVARVACGVLLLLSAVSFVACGDGEDSDDAPAANATTTTSAPKSDEGSLKADPNPVPAGPDNGKTKITWTTKGNKGVVKVYVSENGQPETLFAQGSEGSVDVPWIGAGAVYEFRLYDEQGSSRKLIDKIQVTRNRS